MRKFLQIAAASLMAVLMPALAFAHGNGGQEEFKGILNFKGGIHWQFPHAHKGTVTATSATGFTFKDANGDSFTVDAASAKIVDINGNALTLANIQVNENVDIRGTGNGSTITAKIVLVTPANTHVAQGGGTVTAVNGSSLTVQQKKHGIVSSFTVNTNASTTVIGSNNATTTVAAITVGTKISAKGLWDEILNVLNAIKIHIR